MLQVFALNYGFDEAKLGVVRLFVQAGGMLGYLLCMRQANRIPSAQLLRKNFLAHLALLILPGGMLLLAFSAPLLPTAAFVALFSAIYSVSNFFLSRMSMIFARVESRYFETPIYGKAFGIAGIVYYLVGMALGVAVKGALTLPAGFYLIFAASLLLGLAGFAASKGFRLIKAESAPADNGTTLSVYPRRKILLVIVMHIFRGLMAAIAYFFMPVALKRFGLANSDAGVVSFLLSAGYLAGYLLIYRQFDKIGAARTALWGAALQIAPFLLLLFSPSRTAYFAFYFIFSLGDILIAQGVPLGILQAVPSTVIGSVTALRLVAMQASDALLSLGIGGVVVENFPLFAALYCAMAAAVAFLAYVIF